MRRAVVLALTLLACSQTVRTTATTDVPRGDDRPLAQDAATPASDVVTAAPDVATADDAAMAPEEDASVPSAEDVPPGTPGDYTGNGPLPLRTVQGMFTAPPSTGCRGTLCNVIVSVTLPARGTEGRAAPWPLAVFSSGFSTPSSAYAVTAGRLASWGYVVVRYDLQGESFLNASTHASLAATHGALIDWVRLQGESGMLRGEVDASRVLAAGHSRGGKVAALAATQDARILGVVGFDPVDAPPPLQMPSDDYPLASARLRALDREVPMVVLGAEFGGRSSFGMPCAPTQYNYATFFDGARGPGLEVVLREAGHGQFVDDDRTAAASAALCPAGSAMNETVRTVSRALLVAWAERTLRGADVTRWVRGEWLQARVADRTISSVRRR
ncbi:MAG: hypothetical protein U0325_06095 [Polyangiales bacterium]